MGISRETFVRLLEFVELLLLLELITFLIYFTVSLYRGDIEWKLEQMILEV